MVRFELSVEAFDTAAKATMRIVRAADFAIVNYDDFSQSLDFTFQGPQCVNDGRFQL